MPGLQFVVTTGVAQFNVEDRKLIRSHVMKGKNLGRMRPLGSRFRRASPVAATQLDNPRRDSSSSPSLLSDSSSPRSSESSASTTPSACSDQSSPIDVEAALHISNPRNFGSLTSAVTFAESVKPETMDIVLQFSSIAKQLLFPIEACILFERRAENWIAPLAVDPACLHARIFTSLSFFDTILPKKDLSRASPLALQHGQQAISLLRERMASGCMKAKLSDNTISVALTLAWHAFWAGDAASAANQVQGIHKIISLRGGLHTFESNQKLPMEILRCDLGLALYYGSAPIFFRDNPTSSSCSEPLLTFPPLSSYLPAEPTSTILPREIQPGGTLASSWAAMSEFCSVINLASTTKQRIPEGLFFNAMTSVMYRLLSMHPGSSTVAETIRVGLVCFSCSVFLPWRHIGTGYPHLASVVRHEFAMLSSSSSIFSPQLVLWLLMAGALGVLDESDAIWLNPLLRKTMTVCGVSSWDETRHLLWSFMWIDLAHDRMGKRVFDSAFGEITKNE